jgi:hypothetical protein
MGIAHFIIFYWVVLSNLYKQGYVLEFHCNFDGALPRISFMDFKGIKKIVDLKGCRLW